MTNGKELLIRQLARLIESREQIDEQIEHRKSELLPHLPGYHKPGTVMVADSSSTLDQRWEVVEQRASFTDGEWQILPKDNWGVHIHADGSRGPRFCFLTIEYYHPEAPGGTGE